jgi:hypothetical protein
MFPVISGASSSGFERGMISHRGFAGATQTNTFRSTIALQVQASTQTSAAVSKSSSYVGEVER